MRDIRYTWPVTERQGLLSLDVEVKDLAVTIDSKEKLLDQLCEAQKEHERLREIYEQTLRECDAEVRSEGNLARGPWFWGVGEVCEGCVRGV